MNQRAQSVITVFFWVLVFVMLWALFLAPFLSSSASAAVTNNNLTGLEALFYENINLVVFIALIIAILAYSAFGANT